MPTDKRLDRGIWKTKYGYRVCVRVGRVLTRKRFPPTYTLDSLRRWREDHIRLHRQNSNSRGTFAADVELYLRTVAAMPTYTDRVREIKAWLERFGEEPRWKITPDAIRRQLAEWRVGNVAMGRKPLAPNTCNHRRMALSHLFTVLDGKNAFNPVREVPRFPLPPPIRRGVPLRIVTKVLQQIEGKKTQARLEVLAWTGMRPSELARLTPAHIDEKRRVALVPTAKGGPPREIPFVLAMKAWKKLVRLGALGRFSKGSARKSLRLACKKAGVPPFRIYDLRHSYLSALRASGADLSDVQAVAGHSDIKLTKRYAPTITAKLQQAVGRIKEAKGSHR